MSPELRVRNGRADALNPGRQKGGHSPLSRAELPADTVSLARYLIGKILVREMAEGLASGRIVETEAYVVGDATSARPVQSFRCAALRQ